MHYTLSELQVVCQKPQWRDHGSLLARRFARPVALYLTWLVSRWPVSANFVTGCTLVVGCAASALIAIPGYFVVGVVALWLWYLLDHVDGQLARLHKSQSVTGVYFDFMMHHLVHPAVGFAIGYGAALSTNQLSWALAGAGFAIGSTALSLSNDCRYKAYFAVLSQSANSLTTPMVPPVRKQLRGVESSPNCGGNYRESNRGHLSRFLKSIHTTLLRLCEIPNIILVLTLLAACSFVDSGAGLTATQRYIVSMALVAPSLAVLRLAKQVWNRIPDNELAQMSRQ